MTTHDTEVNYKSESSRVQFSPLKKKKQASILPAMVKAFGSTFLFGALLKLFQDILMFVNPQVLKCVLDHTRNNKSTA